MNDLTRLSYKSQVIYDFDCTVARIVIDWSIWQDGVEKIFKKYDDTFVRNGTVHQFTNQMIVKYGKPLRDEVCEFNKNFEDKYNQGVEVNQELVEYIKNNSQQKHYLLTSNCHLLIDRLLVDLGLENSFTKVITRDDVLLIKPDTEGINKIIDGQNVTDFIYLGDSVFDEETAKAVGMDFEWIKMS